MRKILYLGILILIVACKKDKVEMPCPEPELTKWEIISGEYKVYDTLGAYLYDMNIVHIPNSYNNIESWRFENFDGEFTFTEKQPNFGGNPELYVQIGYHDTLFDGNGKRWKILLFLDEPFNNVWASDTIPLSFRKTNINYWIEDAVPYFACDCKQIAVKQ
jgi:hypothetical protein